MHMGSLGNRFRSWFIRWQKAFSPASLFLTDVYFELCQNVHADVMVSMIYETIARSFVCGRACYFSESFLIWCTVGHANLMEALLNGLVSYQNSFAYFLRFYSLKEL